MKIFLISEEVSDWQDAIKKTSSKLFEEGYVTNEFGEQCIIREGTYPTGLNTLVPIAIPHTDSEYVHESAICLLKPKNQVDFINMEDSETIVKAEYVLNLAIKDNKSQVPVLSKVIGLFNDMELIRQVNKEDEHFLKKVIETEMNLNS